MLNNHNDSEISKTKFVPCNFAFFSPSSTAAILYYHSLRLIRRSEINPTGWQAKFMSDRMKIKKNNNFEFFAQRREEEFQIFIVI